MVLRINFSEYLFLGAMYLEEGNNSNSMTSFNEAANEIFSQVKKGNRSYKERFIGEHEGFVLKCACGKCDDSTLKKNSDEFHVGLFAFIYSIDKFAEDSYEDFLAFSKSIIEKWLEDYLVKDQKIFKEEIAHFKNKLWEFGVTIPELISSTPNDPLSIRLALKAAKDIVKTEPLFEKLNITKKHSYEELTELNKVIAKRIKKNPKYTIALILILKSRVEVLKNYLKNIENEDLITDKIGTVIERSKESSVYITGFGRFDVIKGLGNVADVGKMVYFNKSKLGSKINKAVVKYATIVAVVLLVGGVSFAGFNFIKGQIEKNNNDKVVITDNTEKPNQTQKPSNEKENSSGSDKKDQKKETDSNKPKKDDKKDVKKDTEKDTEKDKGNDTEKNTVKATQTKDKQSSSPSTKSIATPAKPSVKPSVKPTLKTHSAKPVLVDANKNKSTKKPTSIPSPTPYRKKTNTSSSITYRTIKATGVPGRLYLSAEKSNINFGESFDIVVVMESGNNAVDWVIYEDNTVIAKFGSKDDSPNPQKRVRLVTPKSRGVKRYSCEASNSFGSTRSDTIEVVVH